MKTIIFPVEISLKLLFVMWPHLILAHSGGGLVELSYYLLSFLSPSILMAGLAGLPKFLILYFQKPKEVVFDKNMFLGPATGEILFFTCIFFLAFSWKPVSVVFGIDYLAQYSIFSSLVLFKIYLISETLLKFFLFLVLFGLPVYGFIANSKDSRHRTFFSTKIGYFMFNLSFPLLLCFWIIVAPSILGNHKEYFHRPFTTDNELNMLLYHAVKQGMPNVVEGLIENGADVNFEYWKGQRGYYWQAPLIVSQQAKRNSIEVAKILIHYGADINVRIGGEKTSRPYLVHLVRGNVHPSDKFFELLLESGADVEAKDRFGKTYLDYLQEEK